MPDKRAAAGIDALSLGGVGASWEAASGSDKVYEWVNRLLALGLFVLLLPLMALVALTIWMTDRSPVFFGHYRVGKGGRLIKVLKFRSMRVDAQQRLAELLATDLEAREEWERNFKLAHDPRITPIGRILRKTSLDELPQLINVIRGEMMLVGPRPITAQELRRYGSARWHYLSVTPGVTGLWQVSGRNELSYPERVELDRYYVNHRSIRLDLEILARTVLVVATGYGAR